MHLHNHVFTAAMLTYVVIFVKYRCQPGLFWGDRWYRLFGFLKKGQKMWVN